MMDTFQKQLEAVINEYEEALSRSRSPGASDVLSTTEAKNLQTRCIAAIERISGRDSAYYRQLNDEYIRKKIYVHSHLPRQIGVVKALLSDIQNGYLRSLEEIIHGDLFSDFLEMASHLVGSGYKDAAAVLAGSTLEVHVRKLCDKHGVTTTSTGKPKSAETLNMDLVKAGAYTKLDQKNLTAWFGLRNDAAHGKYNEYTQDQVRLLIDSIRDFISRHPA